MNNAPIEFDLYITPDGTEFLLSDFSSRAILRTTGLGIAPLKTVTQRGPFQHGETLLDYRLDPRIIQLVLRANAFNRDRYWTLRQSLINSFRPNRNTTAGIVELGKFRKILRTGLVRDIDVFFISGIEFAEQNDDWDAFGVTEGIRFFAPDPTFYDPSVKSSLFALTELVNLVFPITFPITFGTSTINSSVNVTYSGNWIAYPTITIVGPLNSLILTNQTTGEFISLSYNIPVGRTVTITLTYGNKTVEDDLGNNLIGIVTPDSSLASFHLAPDPEAPGGVNTINVVASGATLATSITLSWYDRFIGI